MKEVVKGFSSCPLCESPVAVDYVSSEDGDGVNFQAVCTNERCGCRSAIFTSLKGLQERWNLRVGVTKVMHNAYDILPTMEESVVETREDNTRKFRIVKVYVMNDPEIHLAYYDGKNFNDIVTREVLKDVEAWTIFDGGFFETQPPIAH